MTSHTPFLSALVLASSAFPAQLYRVGVAATPDARPVASRVAATLRSAWLPVSFLLVAALAWYVAPVDGPVLPAAWWWYPLAVAVGLAAPAWEVAAGFGIALVRRRRPVRVAPHRRWGAGASMVAAAVAVGVAEEVIFRGVGLSLLVRELGVPVAAAVALTAAVYGVNHLYFGGLTVAQKCVTGVVFGVLFVASGYRLAVPLLAHVAQNLLVSVGWPGVGRASRGGQSGRAVVPDRSVAVGRVGHDR